MKKSEILKQAWVIFKTKKITFSDALKLSWKLAKTPNIIIKSEAELNFNALYTKYHDIVYNFIRQSYPKDIGAVEQITNDTFMNVHHYINSFDSSKSQIQTWIINIAKNIRNDYYRKNKKRNEVVERFNIKKHSHNVGSYFQDNVQTSEVKTTVNNALNILNENQRKVCELRFIHEMKYEEIAEMLCISLSTVKITISRSRKILQSDHNLQYCHASMYN